MSEIDLFNSRSLETAKRAKDVSKFAHLAQFKDGGRTAGSFISSSQERAKSVIDAAMESNLFEGVDPYIVKMVAPAWAEAYREHAQRYGERPNSEMLANAAQAFERMMFECGNSANRRYDRSSMPSVSSGETNMFESVSVPNPTGNGLVGGSTSVSEGVYRQAIFASMILPYTLGATTSDAATFIPCARDNNELYTLMSIAGTTFGDLKEGDVLTPHTAGRYSQMKRKSPLIGEIDGENTEFTFKVPDAEKREIPIRESYSRLIVNSYPSPDYDNGGNLTWYSSPVDGVEAVNATVAIKYKKGEATIKFSKAPAKGTRILFEYQIDIEARGGLIPVIAQKMNKRVLKPNQYALGAEHTVQALFDMQREFNIDTAASLLNSQRDFISHEIDMTRLRTMLEFNVHRTTFDVSVPSTLEWDKFLSLLKGKISQESTKMSNRNMVTGIRGIFAGQNAAELIKMLPKNDFEPSTFTDSPRIEYIGKLFGRYFVYQVPEAICDQFKDDGLDLTSDTLFCYGRGTRLGEAGLVTGDAVPAIPFNHPTDPNLINRTTIWGSMINDVNPFNGWDYFVSIELTLEKEDAYSPFDGSILTKKPNAGDDNKPPADDENKKPEGGEGEGEEDKPTPPVDGEGEGKGEEDTPTPPVDGDGEGKGEEDTPTPPVDGEGKGEENTPTPPVDGEGEGEGSDDETDSLRSRSLSPSTDGVSKASQAKKGKK